MKKHIEIIKKLRKIKALTNSPYPEEALAAAAHYTKLTEKFGIDPDSPDLRSISEKRTETDRGEEVLFHSEYVVSRWIISLSQLLMRLFQVSLRFIVKDGGFSLLLQGPSYELVRCRAMFNHLYNKIEMSGKNFDKVVRDGQSFRWGLIIGIIENAAGDYPNIFREEETDSGEVSERKNQNGDSETGDSPDEQSEYDDMPGFDHFAEPNSFGLGKKLGRKMVLPNAFLEKN